MANIFKTVLFILLILGSLTARAQNWSTVLDPSRAIDWTGAGFTIPSYSTPCATQPTLLAGSSNAGANTTAIQNALASCTTSANVVNIGAGTYYVAGITFPDHGNQVLRGAGPTQTKLIMTASSGCTGIHAGVCMMLSTAYNTQSAPILPGGNNQCSWTAGFGQGSTSITLNSCPGGAPSVGQQIILDQSNDLTDNGGVFLCDSFTYSQPGGSQCTLNDGGANDADGRQIGGYTYSQKQIVTVQSVTGAGPYTVGISPSIYFNNIRLSQNPSAWWPGLTTHDGLENLYIDGSALDTNNIEISDCYQCWVKNVASYDANRAHVMLFYSLQDVVRDSYFFQSQSHAEESYGVEQESTSADLIENNICQQLTNCLMGGNSSGSVFGYNFSVGSQSVNSNYLTASFPSHNAGNDMLLMEGNNVMDFNTDDTWGSSNTETYFRNHLTGWQHQSSGPMWGTEPFIDRSMARVNNVVGNVLGQPGYHTNYESYATSKTAGTNQNLLSVSIYSLGWTGYGETSAGTCTSGNLGQFSNGCDAAVRSTLMRWGNYDVVNGATQWNSTEAAPGAVSYVNANFTTSYFNTLAHTLPASLYYSSKPSWWPGEKNWPAIGPDVTTGNVGICTGTYAGAEATSGSQCIGGALSTAWASHATSIPAQDCYLSMGGAPDGTGSMLNFDANTCYFAPVATGAAQGNHIGLATGQQKSTANWGNCGSSACAGGAGNSTSFTMTTGVVSPSISGASMALSFSSPASGNNGLYYMKPGVCDSCTWILYDFWWYPSAASANHEADSFIFNKTNGDWDAMFGHQCNTTTGHWQYANQTSSWSDTSMSCSSLTAGAWHHVIFYDWYLASDRSCTGSVPCQHFGTVTVDGSTQSWSGVTMPVTTLNPTWSSVYGCQVQEDSNASATVTMYVDSYNCWVGK